MAGIQKSTPTLRRVLAVLLAAHEQHEWLHVTDVVERARAKYAAVHPMLDKLQAQGWVTADWDPPSRPARPRRPIYRLTGKGVAAAGEPDGSAAP